MAAPGGNQGAGAAEPNTMSRITGIPVRPCAFAMALCLAATMAAAILPARADEVAFVAQERAHRAAIGRASYGITMTTIGFAMVPVTTESILAGRLHGKEAGGLFLSAALLGIGGLPFITSALRSLDADPLAGPRARLRLAEKGVLAYAIVGCMFGSIGMIATAVIAAKHDRLPVDLAVLDASSLWLLGTAIGLAADGDLARRQVHGPATGKTLLDQVGGPLLGYGILLLTLVTPALRLCLDKDGLPLEPTLVPLLGGVAYFTAGMICVVAAKAALQRSRMRQARVRLDLLADPGSGTYGLALSGRF